MNPPKIHWYGPGSFEEYAEPDRWVSTWYHPEKNELVAGHPDLHHADLAMQHDNRDVRDFAEHGWLQGVKMSDGRIAPYHKADAPIFEQLGETLDTPSLKDHWRFAALEGFKDDLTSTSGTRYFHATDAELQPGDIVHPAATQGVPGNFPDAPHYDPKSVYIFDHNTTEGPVGNWGWNIYEVEPKGDIRPDPERGSGGPYSYEEDDPAYGSWVTPQARVIRRLPDETAVEDWQTHTARHYDQLKQSKIADQQQQRWIDAFNQTLPGQRFDGQLNREGVEWVPTKDLLPYMEYDRDLDQSDYTKDLRDHVTQNGVRVPLILEYNQDTGRAHLGEGNHRLKIMNENGEQYAPVKILTTMRQGQNDHPVPQPAVPDEHGYVPSNMAPSQLGFVTR